MYTYEIERPKLFTEEGQVMLLQIRDNVKKLLSLAGAVRAQEAWKGVGGDGWLMLACLDRLVELREIREITDATVHGQSRVFVALKYES